MMSTHVVVNELEEEVSKLRPRGGHTVLKFKQLSGMLRSPEFGVSSHPETSNSPRAS